MSSGSDRISRAARGCRALGEGACPAPEPAGIELRPAREPPLRRRLDRSVAGEGERAARGCRIEQKVETIAEHAAR